MESLGEGFARMREEILQILADSASLVQKLLTDKLLLQNLQAVCEEMVKVFERGNKVLLCGNGGSAADAQHIAAELSGRFLLDRSPVFAEALHVNTSYLTAVANDYSYDEVFARLVRAKGKKGDMWIGLSTSGNSENVVRAAKVAREIGMTTVGMTGAKGGRLKELCQYTLLVPSTHIARVQEAHLLLGHVICEIVEKKLFGK